MSYFAAMAMAHLGAKGDSAEQIDKAFMFSKIEEGKFHSAFGELHALMLDKVGFVLSLYVRTARYADNI